MSDDASVAPVTLGMLKALHQAHLRDGAEGTAAEVHRIATQLGATARAVVRGVRVAAASAEPEVAGWGRAVAAYVEGALARGALAAGVVTETDQRSDQSTRSASSGA